MCARCQAEYEDPLNRRFHAEPNACPDCGPSLALLSAAELSSGGAPRFARGHEIAAILDRARSLLREGRDPRDQRPGRIPSGLRRLQRTRGESSSRAQAPQRQSLRHHGAHRSAVAERICDRDRRRSRPARRNAAAHRSAAAPRADSRGIAVSVAPGNARLGVMLPYTPLHHLLFDESLDALVMTSGNMSEEPIVSRNEDAWPRLHSSPIIFCCTIATSKPAWTIPCSRSFEGREYPVRRSRGYAPDPIASGATAAAAGSSGLRRRTEEHVLPDQRPLRHSEPAYRRSGESRNAWSFFAKRWRHLRALLSRRPGGRGARPAPELSEHPLRAARNPACRRSACSIITRTSRAAWPTTESTAASSAWRLMAPDMERTARSGAANFWSAISSVSSVAAICATFLWPAATAASGNPGAARSPICARLRRARTVASAGAFRDIPAKAYPGCGCDDRAQYSDDRDFLLRTPFRRRLFAAWHPP